MHPQSFRDKSFPLSLINYLFYADETKELQQSTHVPLFIIIPMYKYLMTNNMSMHWSLKPLSLFRSKKHKSPGDNKIAISTASISFLASLSSSSHITFVIIFIPKRTVISGQNKFTLLRASWEREESEIWSNLNTSSAVISQNPQQSV